MAVRRVAPLLALLGACSSSAPPASSDAGLQSMTFAHPSIRDVDVLFVVDDAPGMAPALARLRAAFASFTGALESLPAGTPNLHVAVISADLGADAETVPGCNAGGDRGLFWDVPRGACTATGLPPGQAFFSVIEGKPSFDPTKSLADALACVAPLEDAGCRFPHPLAAVLRALGADDEPPPPENAGFLRPDAFLSIVLVTNQDDCSAPATSSIFDPASMFVDDPLGPLTSFRCAEYGVSCGGQAPSRTMAGTLAGCQSAEDGMLLRISDVVSRLNALKAAPNMILVASISGPPDPFTVELYPSGLPQEQSPWPALSPSCTSADGVVSARPGVRVEQWAYAFGHNGVVAKLCDDLGASLQTVAASVAGVLGPPCLSGPIATKQGPHGARPDCTIVDYATASSGTPIPSCVDVADAAPCWTLAADAVCPGGRLLAFSSDTDGGAPLGPQASVACAVCDDPADPRCR